MPPIELKKRGPLARPSTYKAAGPSVATAFKEALGLVEDAATGVHKIARQERQTRNVEAANKREKTHQEQKLEEDRITGILQNPMLTVAEANELLKEVEHPLNKVAINNRIGEVMAQNSYEELAVAANDAVDVVAAREAVTASLAKTLEDVTDPSIIAGVNERYAAFTPRLLTQATNTRLVREKVAQKAQVDADLYASLDAGSDALMTSTESATTAASLTGQDPAEVVAQSILAVQNFYDAGREDGSPTSDNQDVALESLDKLINSPMITGATKSQALAVRDGIYKDVADSVASTGAVDKSIRQEAFVRDQAVARRLIRAGRTVDQDLINRMNENATTTSDFNEVDSLADHVSAPGLTGTEEFRSVRSDLRTLTGIDSEGLVDNEKGRERYRDTLTFYDKGARRLEKIQNPGERYAALESLADKANAYGLRRLEEKEKNRKSDKDRYDAYVASVKEANQNWTAETLVEFGLDPGKAFDAAQRDSNFKPTTFLRYKRQQFADELEEWATANGVDLSERVGF